MLWGSHVPQVFLYTIIVCTARGSNGYIMQDMVLLDSLGMEIEQPFSHWTANDLTRGTVTQGHLDSKGEGMNEGTMERGTILGWLHSSPTSQENTTATTPANNASETILTTPTQDVSEINTTADATMTAPVSSCGSGGRIVGGTQASAGAWPWMAAVKDKNGGQFCGGTLVSWRHVITAAHCIKGGESRFPLKVSVGIHRKQDTGKSAFVAHALYHRDYSKGSPYNNDIAVLVLTDAVGPANGVVPACLPSSGSTVSPGSPVTVVGWGATSEGGPSSSTLKQLQVKVLDSGICSRSYGSAFSSSLMICAGNVRGGEDSCQGDSGGPLTYQQGRWTLVGVVSYGRGCARPNYPGVYTKVSHYISWINRAMQTYP